jgi:hypothetical protein
MELMAEADNVVRRLLPTVLESTGENEEARRLRDHSKLSSRTAEYWSRTKAFNILD